MAKVRRVRGDGYAKLEAIIANSGKAQGKSGWFESAQYADGTPVAYVAAIHEYGYEAGGIPPRPFMRSTIAEKQGEWKVLAQNAAKQIAAGRMSSVEYVGLLAATATGHVQKKIGSITAPPLKLATVQARARRRASGVASDKPLVDTAIMLQTMTSIAEGV
jgi:hypothetical protein